jgi:hypothetical protein
MRAERKGSPRRPWRRARAAALDAGIVGGVVAAPIGAALAIVGLLLPRGAPLHHVAGAIFGIVALWFLAAVLCANPRLHPNEEDRAGR